jgi:excisionase family DNA binding protein
MGDLRHLLRNRGLRNLGTKLPSTMTETKVMADKAERGSVRVLTVKETAEMLGRNQWTIYRWCKKGHIPARKVGGSWVLLKGEVLLFLAGRTRGGEKRDASGK